LDSADLRGAHLPLQLADAQQRGDRRPQRADQQDHGHQRDRGKQRDVLQTLADVHARSPPRPQ